MSFVTEINHRILQDPAAGRQQAEELHRLGRDEQRLRDAQLLLAAGRDALRSTDPVHVPFDRLEVGVDPVGLIARGEVLVAGDSSATERAILDEAGFAIVSGIDGLRRYRKSGAPVGEVLTVVDRLTEAGSPAAPNYVIVAGHTIKAGYTVKAASSGSTAAAPGSLMAGIVLKTAMSAAGPRPTASDPGNRPVDDRRGAGVRVAVLDTAVDPADVFARHGFLADLAVDGPGDSDGTDRPDEPDAKLDGAIGHGAFVAGLVRQVAPAAEVQVLTVLAGDGLGTEYALCAALDRLAGADIAPHLVNLSLSCATPAEAVPVGLPRALDRLFARHPDVVVVAAAGNSGQDVAPWPAAHPNVVAVAAVGADGGPAAYSNRGAWVDFSAPGDGLVSVHPPEGDIDTGFAAWTGTSFAAPQVVGALAALIGEGRFGYDALATLRAESTPRTDVGHVL